MRDFPIPLLFLFTFNVSSVEGVSRDRWDDEAKTAILELERVTGKRFESKAKRSMWVEVTRAEVDEVVRGIASGFYEFSKVEERRFAKIEADKEKKIEAVKNLLEERIENVTDDAKVSLLHIQNGLPDDNVIFLQSHTHNLCKFAGSWHEKDIRERY